MSKRICKAAGGARIKDEFDPDPDWKPTQEDEKDVDSSSASDEESDIITVSSLDDDVAKETSGPAKELRAVQGNYLCQDVDDYINSTRSQNTRKLDAYVLKAYQETMKTVALNQNLPEVPNLLDTPIEDLPILLERFIMVAVTQKGELYNASTYDQFYQTLARILLQRKKDPVDIKADVRFKRLERVVKSRKEAAVKAGNIPGMNAAKAVSPDLIREAFEKKKFGRDSPRALVCAVNYIMTTGWGCRPGQETRDTNNEHLVYSDLDTDGFPNNIKRFETMSKCRRGDEGRELIGTIYKDDAHPDVCPVRTICEYMARKTPAQRAPDQPFMLNVNLAAEKDPSKYKYWYAGIMGKNQIGKLFRTVFEELGVDCKKLKISANSGRKQLLQAGADAMVPGNFLSKLAGHKIESSQLNYMRIKDDSHKAASLAINRRIFGKTEGTDFGTLFKAEQKKSLPAASATSGALEELGDEASLESNQSNSLQNTPASGFQMLGQHQQGLMMANHPQILPQFTNPIYGPGMMSPTMMNPGPMMSPTMMNPGPMMSPTMMSPTMMNPGPMMLGHTMTASSSPMMLGHTSPATFPMPMMMSQPQSMMYGHSMNATAPMMHGPHWGQMGSSSAEVANNQGRALQDVTNFKRMNDGQGGMGPSKFKFKRT